MIIDFKVMVVRILHELKEKYIIMKKDIEAMNGNKIEMKTTIFEMKNN